MSTINFNKEIGILFKLILIITIFLTLISCDKNINGEIIGDGATNLNSQPGVVSLQIINYEVDGALLEISNKTSKSIYLPYSPSDQDKVNKSIYYQLLCKKTKDRKSVNHGIVSHIVPILNALESNKSVQFRVKRPPILTTQCELKVLFYEDKNVANLVNYKNSELNDSEIKLVEQSKRFATLPLSFEAK